MSLIEITPKDSADEEPNWLALVRRQVESLHFGVVQIVVHDSRVTQVEKTERLRLEPARR
jgi:hypothetical protein